MKRSFISVLLFVFTLLSFAAPVPTLIFSGYIDYPSKREYRIEIFTYPSGLISRVVTYSGDPQVKFEEMVVSMGASAVVGIDQFQDNRRTIALSKDGAAIHLVVENENVISHKKTKASKEIRVRPGGDALFDDGEKRYSLLPTGTFRIESKADKTDAVIVQGNQILDDGWYRSDWRREGGRVLVSEYTAMETPGDWISDGGGVFSGGSLFSSDPITNIMNFFLLDIYSGRHIFLPFIFGLKTGSS